MSFVPFSRMNRRQARIVFDQWQERIPAQADVFSQRVWGAGQTCDQRGWSIDDLPMAVRHVGTNLHLVVETPPAELPLWLQPGGMLRRPFNTAPDVSSAWLLDEYASWNVRLALKVWSGSELIMFNSPMRSRDSSHNCWEVSTGSDVMSLGLDNVVNMVLTFGWPSDQRSHNDDELVEMIDKYQRGIFGLEVESEKSAGEPIQGGVVAADDEPSWATGEDVDDMLAVEVSELSSTEHQVSFGCLEFIRDEREQNLRVSLAKALASVPGALDVDWEDREVANVRGSSGGQALFDAAVAVLHKHRDLLSYED